MRDSRQQRQIAVVALTAAIGAVIANVYLQPLLERKIK